MTTRKYKDPTLQRIYDHYRSHPPIKDGRRHRGSSDRASFWDGVDNMRRGGRLLYLRISMGHVIYMAGRDSRNDDAVCNAERVNIAHGIMG